MVLETLAASFETILGGLFAIAYAVAFYRFLTLAREHREKRKQKFFSALDKGFNADSIDTLEDIANIYKGISKKSAEDMEYRAGLSHLLREYLVRIIDKSGEDSGQQPTIKTTKTKLTDFIAQNDEQSPYADLPDHERSIISDITSYLKHGDQGAVQRKLEEMGSAIQARADEFSKIRNLNKWSVPLAVVGLALTVLFGIAALIR